MKKYNEEILKEIETIKEVFEEPIKVINQDTKEYNLIKEWVNTKYRDLYCCYNRCSDYKQDVFKHYLSIYSALYNKYECLGFGVCSYNQMQFTLCMKLRKDHINYKIYITKCYNKIIAY